MVKYRLLSSEELEVFQSEFVEYLVVNGIDAQEWERLKKEEMDHANKILDLFSDVIMEGALRKIKYLEFYDRDEIRCFFFNDECIELIRLTYSGTEKLDFTKIETIERMKSNYASGLRVGKTEKPYQSQREVELFEMITLGCEVSKGDLFSRLTQML